MSSDSCFAVEYPTQLDLLYQTLSIWARVGIDSTPIQHASVSEEF